MTRKTAKWPAIDRAEYELWCKEFEGAPFVRRVLENLEEAEREQICTMLFLVHLGPQQLTRREVMHIWPQAKLNTRIDLTDYVIMFLRACLKKKKSRSVNEDIAAILTSAGVPVANSEVRSWSAEAVKKRRARITPLESLLAPRYLMRKRRLSLFEKLSEHNARKRLSSQQYDRDKNALKK
jgi:hypothetical protein